MSAALARLRKKAAELEQKKQFDKALEVYIQILDEGGKDLGDEDVPLFNRVGDMLIRKGNVTEALGYYERAVDVYAERGFLNNAIALCSKILRQSPGRAAVYYKLARISARKGFKSDARKNFLEYADRMQKAGQSEEAFRALKEFASLYPDQDDVRLVLAELLSKENRKGEALEQLQTLYDKLNAEGRQAEARATIDRMRAIDPTVTPRETAAAAVPGPADLVFLDLSDAEPRPRTTSQSTVAQQPSARAPIPSAIPALDGLALTFVPDESESVTDAVESERPEGFEATAVAEVPVLDERLLTPADIEIAVESELLSNDPRGVTDDNDFELAVDDQEPPARIATVESTLEILAEEAVQLDDLIPTAEPESVTDVSAPLREQPPLSGSEFAGIELEEAPRRPTPRAHDLALPGDLPVTPDEVLAIPAALPESIAAGEDARAAAEEAADLAADVAAREVLQLGQHPAVPAVQHAQPDPEFAVADAPDEDVVEGPMFGEADLVASDLREEEPALGAADALAIEVAAGADTEDTTEPVAPAQGIGDDFLAIPPSFGPSTSAEDHAFPPIFGLDDAAAPNAPDEVSAADVPSAIHTPRSTISIGGAEGHLRRRLELEPENWELRRMLGEALLDTGDREGGLYELELAMTGFELDNDIDHAQEVVDEILGVFPGSVRHHQKRVEYAVRSRDRARLTHSYLELGDALFRTGAGDKAVAVYARVLELDSGNERAEFALATLAPDELARLRDGKPRPDRWSDELNVIDGDYAIRAEMGEPSAIEHAEPEQPEQEEPAQEQAEQVQFEQEQAETEQEELYDQEQEALAYEEQRADVPEPDGPQQEQEPEPSEPDVVVALEVASDLAAVADPTEPDAEDAPNLVGVPEIAPDADIETQDATTSLVAHSNDSHEEPGTNGIGPDGHGDEPAREGQPSASQAPAPPRSPTPRAVPLPDESSRIDRVRRLTPVHTGDSGFVDLGEWLRLTEPTKSTRMLVEDPKPTGDEQADFEEMLRRFKRGVAENVEAEDYEAHYDLGVAYKEMGLVDEAIAQFQKALRGASHRVRSYEALGQCFVEKEQYPIAAALLQRATELPGTDDHQLVGVLYLLGFAMEHMGRPADALPYYLRVFAVDIEFRDIAERVAAMGNTST
jgi:tetratricopeptide (TPR) repeat protein